MNSNYLKITNGKIITPYRIIPNGTILIKDGIITEVSEKNISSNGAQVIDAQGKYVSPGFIDIHVHGGGGHDFMDSTEEAFLKAAEKHAEHGTTSMLPTTVAGDMDELRGFLDLYEKASQKNEKGSQFLGIHLEGPYFAKSQVSTES
jgi:N-acetylglucosamine-6-phosphate deacetylase